MSSYEIRPQASGYSEAGASTTKRSMQGFVPNSSSPHEDIDMNNSTLRQRSRMLYMSTPLASSAIKTNKTKAVGVGLTFKSSVKREVLGISAEEAKAWQKKTEAEFGLWANKKQNCDALGLNNFAEMQQLTLTSWLLSGDVFPLFKWVDPTPLNPYSLRLHIVEADRVSTPGSYGGYASAATTEGTVPAGKEGSGNKIYDGVEVDKNGRVVAYHICSEHPTAITLNKREWIRVTAFGAKTGLPNILHIMDSERPDQYRGVPYLSHVIEPLLQLRRYTEAELMAALVQSYFTAWIETGTDTSQIPINEVGGVPSNNPDEQAYSGESNQHRMGPGTVLHLKPGETVKFGNPNIPTAGFETFVKTIAKIVGAGAEIPYDVLIKEFNSSYSASRGALMEAWEAIKVRRNVLVNNFCQPVYEVWLTEAVARGRIKAPGFFDDPLVREAWCGARWIGPVQGQLDPKKEAEANILQTDCGIKTHTQVTTELSGGDWEENIEQLKAENALLAAAGSPNHVTIISQNDKEEEED